MANSKENPMLVREPFTLTPTELAKLLQVISPYMTRVRNLEEDLASTKTTFHNLLAAWLTGRGLEGQWNFNFQTGEVNPVPVHVGLDTAADAKTQPHLEEGEPHVPTPPGVP